jgi:DNA-binding transcriptional MerR regulator
MIKAMKAIEEILRVKGQSDSKHKLNTSSCKNIPLSLLDDIQKGITTEFLNNLLKEGYNIYRYYTQITVHGICHELETNRIGYYANLILNGNKSLGIKWNAIDREKKCRIGNTLSYFDWKHNSDSSGDSYSINKRVTEDNFMDVLKDFQNIVKRIDTSLFYGDIFIQKVNYYGMKYLYIVISLNGILESNIDSFIIQVTGCNISEVKKLVSKKNAQREKEREQRDKEYEIKRAERKKIQEEKLFSFLETIKGRYEKVAFQSVPVNSDFYRIRENYNEEYELQKWNKKSTYSKPYVSNEKGTKMFHEGNRFVYIENK